MYCKNCGKELMTDARFCMFCGTPVTGTSTRAVDDVMEEPELDTKSVSEHKSNDKDFASILFDDEPQAEEPKRERTKINFDEINWNVSEYPDTSEDVHKTEDIDFNWNADPADIPEPKSAKESRIETQATAEPAIESISDVDKKLENVIKGSDLESELFGTSEESSDELSASEKIDKFYTFNKKNEEFQNLLNKEYDKVKTGNAIGDELTRADELAQERFDARASRKPATMEDFLESEGIVKPYQPKAFESDVLERIEAQEAERAAQKAEEEARKAALEQAKKEAEAARIKAEEEAEAARKASEEYRIRQEAEAREAAEKARAEAEAEARQAARAAEEARAKAEEEARARAEEESRRAAAEAKIREEEEARRVAEEEARIKAEAVAKYQAAEEARIKKEEELKAAQEAAKIKAQQEARRAAEAAAKFETEKKKKTMLAEEAKKKLEREQARLTREANNTIATEEARKVLEQTVRIRDEEAAKIKAAVAGLRSVAAGGVGVASAANKDAEAAHQTAKNQIKEMAKARDTFFGELDMQKQVNDAQSQSKVDSEPAVTSRDTMLGSSSNLGDTRVIDKEAIMAGLESPTIKATRDQFADLEETSGRPIDFKESTEHDSVDDLLAQLETVENEDDFDPIGADDFEPIGEENFETIESNEEETFETVEDLPDEESVDDFDDFENIDDFGDLDNFTNTNSDVEEPTLVFGTEGADVFGNTQDMSQTRRFDVDETVATQSTDDTIVISQAPQTFSELPANDFDDYGNDEVANYMNAQQGVDNENDENLDASANNEIQTELEPAEAYDEPVELTKKEKKAAAKEAKAAKKAEAKAAKAEAKAAKKNKKDGELEEDEAPAKGGIGRKILVVLLILLCLVLAAEVVGIGVHYVAPQSKVAEIVDTQLNKVIHKITGDEDTDYTLSIGQDSDTGSSK